MSVLSQQTGTCLHGIVLETTLAAARYRFYIVLGEADLDAVADILPATVFEESGEVHVCGLESAELAAEHISEVLENMQNGDVAVVFCATPAVEHAVRYSLRLPGTTLPPHLN